MARALFIHRGGLGDFVLCFPILQALKDGGFNERILITLPSHGRLAEHLSLCEKALTCDSGEGFRLLSQDPSAPARLGAFDLVLAAVSDPDRSFESFLKQNLDTQVCVFFPRPPENAGIHAADYLLKQLPGRALPPAPEDRWRGKGKILLHPGSGSGKKNYPPEDWMDLYSQLGPGKAEFLLGPVELEVVLSWPGQPVMPGNLVQLAETLMEAQLLVSHDSGVAHLAAWLGVPVIAVFKTTDPAVWAPKGKRVMCLRKIPAFPKDWPCPEWRAVSRTD